MRNTSHSQPCAAVPDSEPLCAERPSELSAETLPLNHGRNSEMSTTSDATPATLSLTVHRRASKLYPVEAVASPADPLAGVQVGPADPLAAVQPGISVTLVVFSVYPVFPAARVPQRGHTSVPAATS